MTAQGVFLGLKAAVAHRRGSDRLEGIRVAVQGLGSVGRALADKLHRERATLIVADLDEARVQDAVNSLGATAATTDMILSVDADVLAPCALGGLFSAETIPHIQAEIVAGAANNQLARHEDARLLMERGILYAPDYVINGGGLINVAAELAPGGYDRADAMARVARIPEVLADIFRRSDAERRPTNDIAQEIAAERLSASRS